MSSTRFTKIPILDGAVAALKADPVVVAWATKNGVINIMHTTHSPDNDKINAVLSNLGNIIIVRRGPVRRQQQGTCSEQAELLLGVAAIAPDFAIKKTPASASTLDAIEDDIRRVLDGNNSIYRTDDAWVEEIHWNEITEAKQILWADIIKAGFHSVTTTFRVVIHQELRD